MKTFKEISEKAGAVAVPGAGLGHAYPKGGRHKDFTDKHVTDVAKHPVADDSQFDGTIPGKKKKKRLADYDYDKTQNKKTPDLDQDSEENQDAAAYEEVVITDDMLEEESDVITDDIAEAIAEVYEALSEENRAAFDILLETDEGFDMVLEFVNEYEFITEDEENDE